MDFRRGRTFLVMLNDDGSSSYMELLMRTMEVRDESSYGRHRYTDGREDYIRESNNISIRIDAGVWEVRWHDGTPQHGRKELPAPVEYVKVHDTPLLKDK